MPYAAEIFIRFSALILNWARDYSILGKADPTTEHQPPVQYPPASSIAAQCRERTDLLLLRDTD
jgi:hypothetical protein